MGKLSKLVLCGFIIFSLTACGSKDDSANESNKTAKSDLKTEKKQYEKDKLISTTIGKYSVRDDEGTESYFSIPNGYGGTKWRPYGSGISASRTDVIDKSYLFIYFTYDSQLRKDATVKAADIKTSADIPVLMKDELKSSITGKDTFNLDAAVKDVVIENSKDVKIKGNDFTKSYGYVQYTDSQYNPKMKDQQVYFVMYSMIFKGCPIYFIVADYSVKQNKHEETEELADYLAKSIQEIDYDEFIVIEM